MHEGKNDKENNSLSPSEVYSENRSRKVKVPDSTEYVLSLFLKLNETSFRSNNDKAEE